MQSKGFCASILLGLSLLGLGAITHADTDTTLGEGWQAYLEGHYQEAAAIWSPLASRGNPEAQANLGLLYDSGMGVLLDPARAVSWYRKSAEQGLAAAQYNLGQMYLTGRGVKRSHPDAMHWVQLAADQGLSEAHAWIEENSRVVPLQATAHSSLEQQEFLDTLSGSSTGTAWSVAPGYAVTSNHIVEETEAVELYDITGRKRTATIILRDEESDLALMRVHELNDFPPALPLSTKISRLGSSVFTVGFPRVDIMGRTPKLTDGIISSVNGYRDDPSSYQISVPIQPGNSGGPLLNMKGEVVGVVASMLGTVTENAESRTLPNVSYAIKATALRKFLSGLSAAVLTPDRPQTEPASLADLAERTQHSVMLIVAAE